MKYVYGPLFSRRLGNSLGISLTPHKVCNFDCVYCQLGPTTEKASIRKEYIPLKEIIDELKAYLSGQIDKAQTIEYVTVSGSGEPTLNDKLSGLAQAIREILPKKIVLITNASLFSDPQVRREAAVFDIIVPSLDAVTQEAFLRVNRPLPEARIEGIIEGLVALRKEFRGQIWLEIMLCKGVNDDLRQIKRMKDVVERINPDKIQINSPVRSTAVPGVAPVGKPKLRKIREIFGERCEII